MNRLDWIYPDEQLVKFPTKVLPFLHKLNVRLSTEHQFTVRQSSHGDNLILKPCVFSTGHRLPNSRISHQVLILPFRGKGNGSLRKRRHDLGSVEVETCVVSLLNVRFKRNSAGVVITTKLPRIIIYLKHIMLITIISI